MACSGYRNTDYSPLWAFLAIIVICILTIAAPYVNRVFQSISNELIGQATLQALNTAFEEIQHPADTASVSKRSFVGAFAGQVQGCDFFVGEIRAYAEGQAVVLNDYAEQQVNGNPIHALLLEDRQIPGDVRTTFPESLQNLAGWHIPTDAGQRQLYLVYVLLLDDGDENCR